VRDEKQTQYCFEKQLVGSSSCYCLLKKDAPYAKESYLPFEGFQMVILREDAPSEEESYLPFERYRMLILKEDAPSEEESCLRFDGFLPFEEGTQVVRPAFEVDGVDAAVGWRTSDGAVVGFEVVGPCLGPFLYPAASWDVTIVIYRP